MSSPDLKTLATEKEAVEAHIDNEEEFEEFPIEEYKTSTVTGVQTKVCQLDDWDDEKPKMSFSQMIKQGKP
ncbi:DSS1/SEM1 family-containing protein [Strongyloides ratti]|uniref:26S proteasome complex subunit dss-1 n=1 Tax=Strongyloides ratti TaxID=34506 RepID=A0A090LK46_STRRB|nr:DSS1/SEM1 family-containing protein [Strongyloides ratti]CEF67915.1 DSS1/SEM1 family-containing protein [Strongyloides ratti]